MSDWQAAAGPARRIAQIATLAYACHEPDRGSTVREHRFETETWLLRADQRGEYAAPDCGGRAYHADPRRWVFELGTVDGARILVSGYICAADDADRLILVGFGRAVYSLSTDATLDPRRGIIG